MIAYVTIGTNDLPRAGAFYDALLAEIGGKRCTKQFKHCAAHLDS